MHSDSYFFLYYTTTASINIMTAYWAVVAMVDQPQWRVGVGERWHTGQSILYRGLHLYLLGVRESINCHPSVRGDSKWLDSRPETAESRINCRPFLSPNDVNSSPSATEQKIVDSRCVWSESERYQIATIGDSSYPAQSPEKASPWASEQTFDSRGAYQWRLCVLRDGITHLHWIGHSKGSWVFF